MAHRFYIPNNRPNAVESGINTGLGVVNTLASLKNQQEQTNLAKGRLDLDRQKMGLEQRRADVELGVPGQEGISGEGTMRADTRLRELQIKAVQQQQDREDEKFRMSVQKANTPPKPGDIDGLEAMIPSISKQLFAPSIEKTSKPLFANVRKLAEQGLTRREIKDAMASTFTGSYNQMQMIDGAKKDFQAAFEQYGPDSPQAQSAKETLDAISDGSIVSVFFPSVAALEAAEQREQDMKIEAQKASGAGLYAPSPLQKLITERQSYIQQGVSEDSPIIKAYDSKISGTDIDIANMTQEEIDTWGNIVNLTGKMPSLGRGKQSTKIRVEVAKSAARQALANDPDAPPDIPGKTPMQAALSVIGSQADTKSIASAQTFLEKQLSSMGSFVKNIELQVDKVAELSEDLETYDTRLLNIPLRTLRGKIFGSPLQSKYDLYLTEIESEIGKLATGSTASVAELSASAQERWDKIHDKNLSVKDMLELLKETKNASQMRLKSVDDQLRKTRNKMKTRAYGSTPAQTVTVTNPQTGETEVWDLTTEKRIK